MTAHTRRELLGYGAGLAAAGLAGCTATPAASPDDATTVETSFFVLASVTAAVVGDAGDVGNLVPFGQHGHGWEPGPEVQRRVAEADAFVYAGEGFQPWADRVVASLADDEADVTVVAAREDVDLLPAGDDAHEHGDHEDDHHEGSDTHDHHEGDPDPHFWLDPTRTATAARTVADGLAGPGDAPAGTFADNAEAYAGELAELDRTFEAGLADRERDDVLVAGHDAFRYLSDRYGVRVHALSSVSPDDRPTPRDVERAQQLVADHGITHVLAPVFESDRAATQLVAETDAEGVLPITSVASVSEEWVERGWGYADVMREVNLPSLRTALGAT